MDDCKSCGEPFDADNDIVVCKSCGDSVCEFCSVDGLCDGCDQDETDEDEDWDEDDVVVISADIDDEDDE